MAVRGLTRGLAQMLALNRIAFGISYVALPAKTGSGWIGDAAEDPRTRVFTRALGARDVALGMGALAAIAGGRDRSAASWMAGHALADGADLFATLAARRELPVRNLLFAIGMSGVSTAIAIAAAFQLNSDASQPDTGLEAEMTSEMENAEETLQPDQEGFGGATLGEAQSSNPPPDPEMLDDGNRDTREESEQRAEEPDDQDAEGTQTPEQVEDDEERDQAEV